MPEREAKKTGWSGKPYSIPGTLENANRFFCLGNGYLNVRSALEERYVGETRDLLVTGTFNRADETEVTELPNLPDITNVDILLDGSGSVWMRERCRNTAGSWICRPGN